MITLADWLTFSAVANVVLFILLVTITRSYEKAMKGWKECIDMRRDQLQRAIRHMEENR